MLQREKSNYEVVNKENVFTDQVINELTKETMGSAKQSNHKSKFVCKDINPNKFIFNVPKMKEKLTSEEYYILSFNPNKNNFSKEDKISIVQFDNLPSSIKSLLQRKRGKFTKIAVRKYALNERTVQLKRNEELNRFNKLFYNFLSSSMPNPATAKRIEKFTDSKVLNYFHDFINSFDGSVFQNQPFDDFDLSERLKKAMRKSDSKEYLIILKFILDIFNQNLETENIEERLVEIHNSFIRKNVDSKAYKTKYVSTKNSFRTKNQEVKERLLHTNYFYYEKKSGKEKLKSIAIKSLLNKLNTNEIDSLDNYLTKFVLEKYKIENLLQEIDRLKIDKNTVDKIIVAIKNHYVKFVRTENTVSDSDKFLLSEIHKYIKGRYRKLNKSDESDLNNLKIFIFDKNRLIHKITNYIRNIIRTYLFYEGRHKIHFGSNEDAYSSEALISLNRKETLFKSLNTITSLIQLSLTNRMRVVHPNLALDYIGTSKHNDLDQYLNDDNYYLWYDLTTNYDSLKERIDYLKEVIIRIKDFRMKVSHYNYDVNKLFKLKDRDNKHFNLSNEMKNLKLNYEISFFRKLYNNNIHKLELDKSTMDTIISYYHNSLDDQMSFLPKPYKIIKSLQEENIINKDEEAQVQQAKNYLLKIIYYGAFQKDFSDNFIKYKNIYNNVNKEKFMSIIEGDTIKKAHEWIQSMVSRDELSYNKWIKFVSFAFNKYFKENGFDLNKMKFIEDNHRGFLKFIEYFNLNKNDITGIDIDKHEGLENIIAISKFLRKRDLAHMKHHLEKYNSFDETESIKSSIRLIKLLLEMDSTDPLMNTNIKKLVLEPEVLLSIIRRDYASLKSDELIEANHLKNKASKWMLEQVDTFSTKDASVVKVINGSEEVEISLYVQGDKTNNDKMVIHNHLLEAYKIGFLDIISSYLGTLEIKNNIEEHLGVYSDFVWQMSKDPNILTGNMHDLMKDLKKNKSLSSQNIEVLTNKITNLNLFTFYKNYFEGYYITQLTNIVFDVFSRFASLYYQLERDYAYLVAANEETSIIGLKKEPWKALKEKSKIASTLGFNIDNKNVINTYMRNDFLHGNIFQKNYDNQFYSYETLSEGIENAYQDFHYHTALRNNHNEIIPIIMEDYYIDASFNAATKSIDFNLKNYDFGLNQTQLKKLNLNNLPLRNENHLKLLKSIFNYKLRTHFDK